MTAPLVGRNKECEILQDLLDSKRAEFLALYGRRRVGKTFLIRRFFRDKDAIFFNVTGAKGGKITEQIAHFAQALGRAFLNGIVPQSGKTWDENFAILTNAITSTLAIFEKLD